jgi:hypothetical protein
VKFINLNSNKIKIINPYLFVNLNNLIDVWLDGNDCVNSNFGITAKSLTKINDSLENCYDNCLNDEECAANIIVTKKVIELVQPEEEFVAQSKFEEFENKTMSKFNFYRNKINRTANDVDLLKKKVDVCLTQADKVYITKES